MIALRIISAIVSLLLSTVNFIVSLFESPKLSYASPPTDANLTGQNYRTPFVVDRQRWLMKIYSPRV